MTSTPYPGTPALPADEPERLAALLRYNVLDTPAEEEFDDFTKLAAQLCGTPIALISLIDASRQWFKSRVGLMPRRPSGNSLLRPRHSPARDLRGAQRPRRPALLQQPAGHRGTRHPLLCRRPIDHLRWLCSRHPVRHRPDPHHLSAAQREALARLGRQVVRQLELRRCAAEQTRLAALQQAIVSNAGVAMLTTDCQGRILSINQAAGQLLDYPPQALDGQAIQHCLHRLDELQQRAQQLGLPPDAELLEALVAKARLDEREQLEWHYRRRDGSQVLVMVSVSAIRPQPGELLGFLFIAHDLCSANRSSCACNIWPRNCPEWSTSIACAPTAAAASLRQCRHRRYLRVTPEQVRETAEAAFAVLHPDDLDAIRASILQSAAELSLWHIEYRVLHPDKGLIWVEDVPPQSARPTAACSGMVSSTTSARARPSNWNWATSRKLIAACWQTSARPCWFATVTAS